MRIMLVEDHELLAHTLALALAADEIDIALPRSHDLDDVLRDAEQLRPDIVVLDLHLEQHTSLPLVAPLRELGFKVVMLTGETDPLRIAECVEAGALGAIPKSAAFDDLVATIRAVAGGAALLTNAERDALLGRLQAQRQADAARLAAFDTLTAKERHVLAALMAGTPAETIAKDNFVAMSTVRSQIGSVLSKLGVNSQLAAVAAARTAGWAP